MFLVITKYQDFSPIAFWILNNWEYMAIKIITAIGINVCIAHLSLWNSDEKGQSE